MDSTIIAAVIAALASIAVAVFTLWQKHQTDLEIEVYRDRLEQYRQHDRESKENAMKQAEILGKACSAIQRIRDSISDLKSQAEPLDENVDVIAHGCDEIVKLYSDSHFVLPDHERRLLHDVKNDARRAFTLCSKAREGKPELIAELVGCAGSFDLAQGALIEAYEKWQEIALRGSDTELQPE